MAEQEIELATYLGDLARGFEAAAQATGGAIEQTFTLAGRSLRLRFAGPSLMPAMTRSLAHLRTVDGSPARYTVLLWDNRSTGIAIPPPPWPKQFEITWGPLRAFRSDHGLSLCDPARGLAVFWVAGLENLAYEDHRAPLRRVLHWLTNDRTTHLVHAGAVGSDAGAVLVVGQSGAGKSTTALACLDAELRFGGDDLVLLRSEPGPYVHSLYSSANLEPDHITRFPALLPLIANPSRPERDKPLVYLYEHMPERVAVDFPLRAIVAPRVAADRVTRIERTSAALALRALAPSTLAQVVGADAQTFHLLADVVRQLPCYVLWLGDDLGAIPRLIADLLAETGVAATSDPTCVGDR